MFIESLNVANFRNHNSISINLEKETYIQGANGSGKTSLVEALSVAMALKSFRKSSMKQLINFDSDYFSIKCNINKNSYIYENLVFYDKERVVKSNGNKVDNHITYIHSYPFISYSPENEGIMSFNIGERKTFLDRVIFYIDREYIKELKLYRELLSLKAAALKSHNINQDYIKILNSKIEPVSASISKRRKNTVDIFNSIFTDIYKDFKEYIDEHFSLDYVVCNFSENKYSSELAKRRVLTGTHLDKIYFLINGRRFENIASYGQRKSLLFFIIFSSLKMIEEKIKDDIILILDDFEAGLDNRRAEFFFYKFSGRQIIITGVENRYINDLYTISL